MNKKELFQKQVEEAVFNIADYVMAELENGLFVGRSKKIRQGLNLNTYVFNEASGRLKALGFLSEIKRFNKSQMWARADKEEYYYKVDLSKHPAKFINSEEGKALLAKRRRKLERNRVFENQLIIEVFGLNKE